ncbi:peptidase inhibitor family I36 protein [Streptosporangium sp. NPDC051023]|uniref:peptidase inhibitor family I36 protein n=1 Tax=Streptosporangium sp. NPDC051023 TaxID=3155410 RepID=UPI00344DFC32
MATLVGATTFVTTGAAQAVDPCNDICFYWGSNLSGSVRSYTRGEVRADFGGDTFTSIGDGQGERVKNNAASVYNDTSLTAEVCYNENYGSPCDLVSPYSWRNLNHTWNDNASFHWL